MSETVNQEATATAAEPERTFTQSEMDAIIGDRLKRERAKYSDYEDLKSKADAYDAAAEASKSDLQKATERADALAAELDALKKANQERELRERISAETGVPASLLRGSSEEDLKAQAEAIKGFARSVTPASYPAIRDGGETHAPTMSREAILAIKDEKQRLKAIQDNINLFNT